MARMRLQKDSSAAAAPQTTANEAQAHAESNGAKAAQPEQPAASIQTQTPQTQTPEEQPPASNAA
jgi:hypothetical protein